VSRAFRTNRPDLTIDLKIDLKIDLRRCVDPVHQSVCQISIDLSIHLSTVNQSHLWNQSTRRFFSAQPVLYQSQHLASMTPFPIRWLHHQWSLRVSDQSIRATSQPDQPANQPKPLDASHFVLLNLLGWKLKSHRSANATLSWKAWKAGSVWGGRSVRTLANAGVVRKVLQLPPLCLWVTHALVAVASAQPRPAVHRLLLMHKSHRKGQSENNLTGALIMSSSHQLIAMMPSWWWIRPYCSNHHQITQKNPKLLIECLTPWLFQSNLDHVSAVYGSDVASRLSKGLTPFVCVIDEQIIAVNDCHSITSNKTFLIWSPRLLSCWVAVRADERIEQTLQDLRANGVRCRYLRTIFTTHTKAYESRRAFIERALRAMGWPRSWTWLLYVASGPTCSQLGHKAGEFCWRKNNVESQTADRTESSWSNCLDRQMARNFVLCFDA